MDSKDAVSERPQTKVRVAKPRRSSGSRHHARSRKAPDGRQNASVDLCGDAVQTSDAATIIGLTVSDL